MYARALPDLVQIAIDVAKRLGANFPGVVAVGLVGSYARDTAGPTSDVDLVVLTDDPAAMLGSGDWFRLLTGTRS